MLQLHLTNLSIFNMPTHSKTALCIPSNGSIKKYGDYPLAIMGSGFGQKVIARYNCIDYLLGQKIEDNGNHVAYIGQYGTKNANHAVFSFPTKNDWRSSHDLQIIIQSCHELTKMCDDMDITQCFIARPNCNRSRINWNDIQKVMTPLLDDRFIIVTQDDFA